MGSFFFRRLLNKLLDRQLPLGQCIGLRKQVNTERKNEGIKCVRERAVASTILSRFQANTLSSVLNFFLWQQTEDCTEL